MMSKNTFPSTKTDHLDGPSAMKPAPEIYQPVDCDFTDELEHVSVKKIPVSVRYVNPDASVGESLGLIKDIKTENQEEHLIMSNGDRIRLDRILKLKMQD